MRKPYNIIYKPEHIRLLHNIILLDLTFSTLWFRCPESPLFPSRLSYRWSLRRTFRLDVPCSQPIGLQKKLPCKHIRFVSCRFKLYRLYVYALQLRLNIIFKSTNLYFISIIDSIIPLHPRDPSTIVSFHLNRPDGIVFDITYIKGLCIYRVYYCVVNNTAMLTNILLYGYRILISLRLFAICNMCFNYIYYVTTQLHWYVYHTVRFESFYFIIDILYWLYSSNDWHWIANYYFSLEHSKLR